MKLQLNKNIATEIELIKKSNFDSYNDIDDFGFMFEPKFNQNEASEFSVLFAIRLKIEDSYLLTIEFESSFKVDTKISDSFINSDFPHVNAPAIAFPYLRAFVSTLLLNAGYEPIMLPSINFSEMHKQKNQL